MSHLSRRLPRAQEPGFGIRMISSVVVEKRLSLFIPVQQNDYTGLTEEKRKPSIIDLYRLSISVCS
jgi:hypothetical protein